MEGNETQRDIYCQCQSLLSRGGKWGQLEILAENGVLSEKEKQSCLCAVGVLRSPTIRSLLKDQKSVRRE